MASEADYRRRRPRRGALAVTATAASAPAPPRFCVLQLAYAHTARELRSFLHDAELEAFVADALGHADTGWWQHQTIVLRVALDLRQRFEERSAAARAAGAALRAQEVRR